MRQLPSNFLTPTIPIQQLPFFDSVKTYDIFTTPLRTHTDVMVYIYKCELVHCLGTNQHASAVTSKLQCNFCASLYECEEINDIDCSTWIAPLRLKPVFI
ncbi:hypothetical protein B5X24_HaOG205023 [Helicoverpa armigera]|nr:hypothetical protein B5X24_HaOG205023 [Helicoverpa armigera]